MTEMSFLEHLQELRTRLLVCLVALFLGAAVAWPLTPTVQRFIQRPLLEPSLVQKVKYAATKWTVRRFPDLSRRLGLEPTPPRVTPHRLNYLAPLEPFFVQMKISLVTGLAMAVPVILYQMWLFFAPALYPHERKYVLFFLPLGTAAFFAGGIFFLYFIWPLIISFSLAYESELLYSLLNLNQYVNFCLRLLLLFGLIFELPLVLLILNRVGLVSLDFLRRQRRLAILLSAVVAAFHADVATMTVVAIPIYGMYELALLFIRAFGRKPEGEPAGQVLPTPERTPETPLSR